MLAAGVGNRLLAGRATHEADHPPKVLLRFGGRTLLSRHISALRAAGVERLTIVTGYRAADIESAIVAEGAAEFVETIVNPDYHVGSVVSLAAADALGWGGDVLLMDADVLYDPRILDRLVATAHANCFLLDRNFEDGAEPVKLCVRDENLIEFRKKIDVEYDFQGESVGFFRFSAAVAERLFVAARSYAASGRTDEPYEEVIRELLLGAPLGTFGFEDITGLPWIEIDFAEDVARAETEVLPRIDAGL